MMLGVEETTIGDVLAHPLVIALVSTVALLLLTWIAAGVRGLNSGQARQDEKLSSLEHALITHMAVEEEQAKGRDHREREMDRMIAETRRDVGSLHARLDNVLMGHPEARTDR